MKVISINRHRLRKNALHEALSVIQDGGVVVFPTETSYGLAADPRNRKAVEKIYRIKGREESKKLPLVASSPEQVKLFFSLGRDVFRFAEKHWPGPLTVILPVRKKRSSGFFGTGFRTDAAVRVPASVWARALPAALGCPVTSTSANRSGEPACYTAAAVRRAFASGRGSGRREQPDLFLDAGTLPPRPPSTIVKPERGKLKVLRQGTIKVGL